MQILIICLEPDATMSARTVSESLFATPTVFWMTSSGPLSVHKVSVSHEMLKSSCEVSRANSDAFAPLGDRAPAGTVTTKFGAGLYMGPALDGLTH